jgi:predicted nucleotidyltransferase
MGKNVMIPLTLLEQTIVLLEHWDVSGCELYVRCDYHNILDSLIWKKQKLELRDAYSKIVQADSQEARDEARIRYLQQKRLLDLAFEDEPF